MVAESAQENNTSVVSSQESTKSTSTTSNGGNFLNSLLDTGDTLALGGFGLGFRASIPKMPSFRVSNIFYVITEYGLIIMYVFMSVDN